MRKTSFISSFRLAAPFLAVAFILLAGETGIRLSLFGLRGMGHFTNYVSAPSLKNSLLIRVPDENIYFRMKPFGRVHFNEIEFRTNEFGMREMDSVKKEKNNKIRIAVLGASVVAGYGVESQDMFVAKLQNMFERHYPGQYEILNFAVPGHDYFQALEYYEQNVSSFDPDVVLFPLYYGDLDSTIKRKKMNFLLPGKKKEKGLSKVLDGYSSIQRYSFLYGTLFYLRMYILNEFGALWSEKVRDSEGDLKGEKGNQYYFEKFIEKRYSEGIPVIIFSPKRPLEKSWPIKKDVF